MPHELFWLSFILGLLLHRGFATQRREGLLRDQHADRGDLHEGGLRQREAGGLRAGGGGSRRCALGPAQFRQPAKFR